MKRFLLLLGVGLLIFSGCAAEKATMVDEKQKIADDKPTITDKKATILQNAANLLREEKLELEAEEVDKLSMRILESIQRGEGSVYLGVDPSSLLSRYAERLQKMGREVSAKKMEGYSKAYFKENVNMFMQW